MQTKEYSLEIGGTTLVAQFSDLANQAHGSCLVKCGGTAVLATAVMSEKTREGGDYLPLTVDYEERFYAIGRILGSQFVRREGRPSEDAILTGRIVDRTIRPLFNQQIRHDIQVVVTVLALDEQDPDTLAVLAASLALSTSNIPWAGPVSAARILNLKNPTGQADAGYLVNPKYESRRQPNINFDLIACGQDGNINMIEVGGFEASEKVLVEALGHASKEIEKLQEFQKKIITEIGKPKRQIELPQVPEEIVKLFAENLESEMDSALFGKGKAGMHDFQGKWLDLVKEKFPEANLALAESFVDEKINDYIHHQAIEKKRRPDGRSVDEVRPISAEVGGISPVLHGSGTFYRGETHVLGVLTLGGPQDTQTLDNIEDQSKKRFMLHYNFPPYSTGETGRMGGTNRRMIGHGALAEKALVAVLPNKEKFPYTIRIVAEAMASNGSTSMASVCAGTLAMMDGGVPITRPVAGIASGLMMENPEKYVVLTDIQGPEDHHGDMDFKVAGTTEGVTAVQMDVKVGGIPLKILTEAFEKARLARLHILGEMQKVIAVPRPQISPRAPRILAIMIKTDQIGLIIGPGGKTINDIIDRTGAEINIEEDGTVMIVGKGDSCDKAADIIRNMTREYLKGERFTGEVVKITEFGAFVNIGPNADGLVHVSEIAPFRVDRVEKYLKLGQRVPVIIKEIDEKNRLSLSIKQADASFIKPLAGTPTTGTPTAAAKNATTNGPQKPTTI
jgi:polyribonucleotide nucleotidyltransferase